MPCSNERRAHLLFVGEVQLPAADLLVGLMPFPRDENDVSRVGAGQRDLDRTGAVRFARVRRGDAALDVGDDRARILAARIIGGNEDAIGEPRRNRAHERPLGRIAIAARAEHHREAARPRRGDRTQRLQHVLERIGRVRVVDHHERSITKGLHAPGNRGQLADASRAFFEADAIGDETAEHAKRVGDVEAAELSDGRRCPTPGRFEIDVRTADARGDHILVHARRSTIRQAVADGAHAAGEAPRQLGAEGIIHVQHRGAEPGMVKSRAFASA